MMMAAREFPTIAALHAGYAAGLDAAAVIRDAYRRLAEADDPGIFIALIPEAEALERLRELGPFDPANKPLWGIPFAVKDNMDVAGLPTTAGCPDYGYMPQATAFAVQRLLEAGAVLIGKTNLDQFATGLVGVRTLHPVPRNAIDRRYVPGGSSSGSAVAVARGIVTFALGTDTAGSGRVPAGLNNIVGLKPTRGTVSSGGVVPACRTLDTISVFAGTVGDADAVYRVMSAHDPADPWSRPSVPPRQPANLPPGLRVGVPDAGSRRFGGDECSAVAFDSAISDLTAVLGGLEPTAIDLAPFFAVAELLYGGPWVAERYQAIRPLIERRPEALHPVTRRIIEGASAYSAADAFAAFYRLAELRRATESMWEQIDVLTVPTVPRPRTLEDLAADPLGPNNELGTYTNFVNLLDLCALSVPGRFRSDGFAAGITLIAPSGHDGLLAALGARLHAASGVVIGATSAPVPPAMSVSDRAGPGEIELAVVGAHLSGLPLNHELTARRARFLRATETAPDYRLYALSGSPPYRPGLLRVAPGEGAAIATEIWALPPAEFGRFVAAIPAPLGIGTLRFADGTSPKGFLVEAEGVRGAADITNFGGWRAYLAGRDG